MRTVILFLALTLLKGLSLKAQTVDFVFASLLMINTHHPSFSICENFREHEKLKFLFHHDKTCYFKAIFDESKADSVIVKVSGDKDPVFASNEFTQEINTIEYYHNFETAQTEYLKVLRQIQNELKSQPQFYKPDQTSDRWLNDTSFLTKEDCYEMQAYYVFKYFRIRNTLVYGTILTDLQCRENLYLIIISVETKLTS